VSIAFALAAAAVFGTADFVGGVASRRAGASVVTVISQAAGFAVLLPALLLLPDLPQREALIWGAVAGLGGGIGLAVFFRALATGVMAIVSPVTAAAAAGLPVVAAILLGQQVGPMTWVGLGVGLVAVLLVGWAKGEAPRGPVLPSIVMAVVAGAGFGIFFVALGRAPHDSGLWPLAAARMCSMGVLVAALVGAGGEWRAEAGSLRLSLASGVLDMSANVLYLLAVRQGNLAVIAVLASLYPAVTVLLSLGLLGERLHIRQLAGVGLALVAVGLIAAA
jgi:drug/metabolite transporter (DMT)-like permease